MRMEIYRGAPFVDMEEEIEFFVEWFDEIPQRILWVYGPKSSGKTTVISYAVDNHLLKAKEKFWVKYFNLRETFIGTYDNFLDTFFVGMEKGEGEKGARIGVDVFGFKAGERNERKAFSTCGNSFFKYGIYRKNIQRC